MDPSESSPQDPQVRVFVACPRSGSALLMRIFAESAVCVVTTSPDSSILEDPANHSVLITARNTAKRFVICKEELRGESLNGDCLRDIFPGPSAHDTVRLVFLIRDPVRVFDSWKKVGWTDVQRLIDCFTNMSRTLHQAPPQAVSCLLYERLVQDPHKEIERICAWWGVPFSETMLHFKQPFGSSYVFANDREKSIYSEGKPLGLVTTVEASSSVRPDVPCHNLLSNMEKDNIEEQIGRLYLECWHDDVQRLRAMLAAKTWFGFDLDDTLHEFRRSSGIATSRVLEKISTKHGTSIPALKEEYSRILREKTANAFSDGKTSFDYRRERFALLLARFSLPQESAFLTELLDSYESTLKAALELKCGALGLLSTIKAMGKKIVIMTEGPQDAQERAVKDLGLERYIDFLATTNHFRVTKVDGLFVRVLEHLGVSPVDMAYVGDNEQRDMKPAMAEGILCVHLDETRHIALDASPPRINTLRKLQYILSGENP